MSGRRVEITVFARVFAIAALVMICGAALAQPREASGPIGGITFNPARKAAIRHKGGQLIRGELIGISPELIHFRIANGKEFQYDLVTIRSISTFDGEFRYVSAYDTYRELVEKARPLSGVTIDALAVAAATGKPVEMPKPPAPSLPEMIDPPEQYAVAEAAATTPPQRAVGAAMPAIPQRVAPAAPAAFGGPAQPFYETGAFKVGFLVACLAVVAFWWRNKVG